MPFNSMISMEKVYTNILTSINTVCPAEWKEGARSIKPSTKEVFDLEAICPPEHASKKPYASEVDDMCRLASHKKHSGK